MHLRVKNKNIMNMKKQYLLFVTAVIACTIVLHSCVRKPKTGASINIDFKKYFDYQVGSYWVFYDSLNKETDSVFVSEYVVTLPETVAPDHTPLGERILIAANDTGLKMIFNMRLFAPNGNQFFVFDGKNNINYDIVEDYPFKNGSEIQGTSTRVTTFLSSYISCGIEYKNVYQIINANKDGSYADTIYLNQDHGLLGILMNNKIFKKRLFVQRSKLVH